MTNKPYIPEPENSPWGEVQHCEEIAFGMFEVSTAGHGGVMVHRDVVMAALSPEARKCAERSEGFYCYEEDCAAAIPYRELLDMPGWQMPPNYLCCRADFEKTIDHSLERWNPSYAALRKKRLEKAQKGTHPLRLIRPAAKVRGW